MERFKEIKTIDDLIFIYNTETKGYFEMRLNSYCYRMQVDFWDVLKEVIDKAGDYYGYRQLIAERNG